MRLNLAGVMLALVFVLANPAYAQVRIYDVNLDQLLCTLGNPCDGIDDALMVAGSWEGPNSQIHIDWHGGPPNQPEILAFTIQERFVTYDDSSVETGCVPGNGLGLPEASLMSLRVRSYLTLGVGNFGTIVANGSGWDVDWGDLQVTEYGGPGQYCQDLVPDCTGGCAAAHLPDSEWSRNIQPLPVFNTGPWTFDSNRDSFTINSTWLRHDLRGFPLNTEIYGFYGPGDGSAPYGKVLAVPFMAPPVVIAMAGGLAALGIHTLRRREDA